MPRVSIWAHERPCTDVPGTKGETLEAVADAPFPVDEKSLRSRALGVADAAELVGVDVGLQYRFTYATLAA